jgi:hypothetical protein
MTDPNKDDYELPLFYGKFGHACAKIYVVIFEPMNRGLDKLSALFSKTFFIDPKEFENKQ